MSGGEDDDAAGGYASPPCFLHEVDPVYAGLDPRERADVMRWRKAERERLIRERLAIPVDRRRTLSEAVANNLEAAIGPLAGLTISAYWPFRGEPDLRAFLVRAAAQGATTALPVVAAKGQPMIFRAWKKGEPLEAGVWNIPIPKAEAAVVVPDVLIAPVVGFDSGCYRLGYGGGFFDRTLAALGGERTVIGVGYDSQAIATIHPLTHDIPMGRIVTESGFRHEVAPPESSATELSSPACSLAEAPDAYAGYLNPTEIAGELQVLRASADLADLALTRALDQVLQRLPSQDATTETGATQSGSIVDRVAQLRARVRDDTLHAALGEVLRLAQKAEKK